MRGCGLWRSSGSRAWVVCQAPSRLVCSACCTRPRSAVAACWSVSYSMAALLTRMSARPRASLIQPAAAATLAGAAPSSWQGRAGQGSQPSGGATAALQVAGAQHHVEAPVGQLAGDLEADTAVAAGDDGGCGPTGMVS